MITKNERAALWAARRQETRNGRVAGAPPTRSIRRVRWALSEMLDAGRLSQSQWLAAMRLKRLIDRASKPAETRFEYASRTTTDPAEAAYVAIVARMQAVDAIAAAQGADEWINRQRVVRAAFVGEPTLSQLVRLYCESSKNVERVRRILQRACDALAEHWAAVDQRAVDSVGETIQQ